MSAHSEAPRSGFMSLPVELMTEIIFHVPRASYPVDFPVSHYNSPRPEAYLARFRVLRTLSVTCRRLREIFFSMAWGHLEACRFPHVGLIAAKDHELEKDKLLARLSATILRKTPYISSHVRSLTITLTGCSRLNWEPISHFVRATRCLPQLHTLQILYCKDFVSSLIQAAVEDHVFPSIQSIALPVSCVSILHCCQNLQSVTAVHDYEHKSKTHDSVLIGAIIHSCPHVENLRFFNPAMNDLIAKEIPKLRSIAFDQQEVSTLDISALGPLRNLSHIELRGAGQITERPPPCVKSAVAAAKKVLQASAAEKKRLHVRYRRRLDDTTKWHGDLENDDIDVIPLE